MAPLYSKVLHRSPDAGGKAYWTDLIDRGLSRVDVAGVILGLDEPIAVAVADLYSDVLDRAPNSTETQLLIAAWHQLGEFGVIARLAGSDQYYEHVAPLDPAAPTTSPKPPPQQPRPTTAPRRQLCSRTSCTTRGYPTYLPRHSPWA
jgi:hypothetical protein